MKTLSLLFVIFISVFYSCSDSNKDSSSASINQTKNPKEYKTDKIIIAEFDGYSHYNDMRIYSLNQIDESSVIENFEQLLESLKKPMSDEYCCCPNYHYSLSFYDKNDNYKTYYVDTSRGDQIGYGPLELGEIDGVLVYAGNFNYCRKIPYREWQNFIFRAKKITCKKYITSDLEKARKLFAYANKNNLAIINNRWNSYEWPFYDGDFKFTVSKFGKKLTEEEIEKSIRMAYPDDNYHFVFSNYYELCGSSDPKVDDCTTKYTVTISCSKDFYRKFDLYKSKSLFNDFHPSFLILGNKNNLIDADSVASIKENN